METKVPLWESRLVMFETDAKKKMALRSTNRSLLKAQAIYFLEACPAQSDDHLGDRKRAALQFVRRARGLSDIVEAIHLLDTVTGRELSFATDGEIHGISDAQALMERLIALG